MIDFDLHIHCAPYSTCASQTLEQSIEQAHDAGVTAIAICNHNTIDGLSKAREICNDRGMTLINGVELTVDLNEYTIDLLGYKFHLDYAFFEESNKRERELYAKRVLGICAYLREIGYLVEDCEELKDLRRQLVELKRFKDEKEAKTFLWSEEIKNKFPDKKMDAKKAIDLIHAMNGKVFWAHPNRAANHRRLTRGNISEIIDILYDLGLDGIEAFHPDTLAEEGMVEYLLEIAKARKLMVSLGSDTHHLLNNGYFTNDKKLNHYKDYIHKIKTFMEVNL